MTEINRDCRLESPRPGDTDLLGEVEGADRRRAVEEALRCLGARSCEACDVCRLLCPDLAITRDPRTGSIVIDLEFCKGCGICAAFCPRGAIRMELETEV